jgi:predicted ABC-type transport system involved in lysophospholipase L1 biosynthesis ATPase subunit
LVKQTALGTPRLRRLSGAEQQRLALARALARDPEILRRD